MCYSQFYYLIPWLMYSSKREKRTTHCAGSKNILYLAGNNPYWKCYLPSWRHKWILIDDFTLLWDQLPLGVGYMIRSVILISYSPLSNVDSLVRSNAVQDTVTIFKASDKSPDSGSGMAWEAGEIKTNLWILHEVLLWAPFNILICL